MRFASILTAAFTIIGVVEAHWEPNYPGANSVEEIARRQLEHEERVELARACGPELAKFEAHRRAKRELAARGIHDEALVERQASQTFTSLTPHTTAIPGSTCITAPDVTEGPYYIKNELIRGDLRETQKGVSLYLDIGVMDISTCTPAPNIFVELWACNATGLYSSFTTTNFPASVARTDKLNHLRGGYYTNTAGIVELATIYPGYYTSRTVHIHVMLHQDVKTNPNGTISSQGGGLRHVGQIYFQETDNDMVFADAQYKSTQTRTYNNQDSILRTGTTGGHSPYASITKLGANLSDGLLGYITLGMDPRRRSSVSSTEYYNPNWPQRGTAKREEEDEVEDHHHHDDEY